MLFVPSELWRLAQRLDCSKRLLFNRGVRRNKWLLIQIDADRKFESTGSGPRFRGSAPGIRGKKFHEYSLPSRDPRGANKPYFCFEGRTASLRRVKLTHSLAATREKLLQKILCIESSRISAEPLTNIFYVRDLVGGVSSVLHNPNIRSRV